MMVTLAPTEDKSRVKAAQAFEAWRAQAAALTSPDAARLTDVEIALMAREAL